MKQKKSQACVLLPSKATLWDTISLLREINRSQKEMNGAKLE